MIHLSSWLSFFSYGKQAAKFEKSTTICIPCPEFWVKMGKIGLAVGAVGKKCAVPFCGDDDAWSELLIESSRCHLFWFCIAVFICVHNSFLHCFDLESLRRINLSKVKLSHVQTNLLIDWIQSLNWLCPSGVIWKAARADRIVFVNSS